MNTEGRTPYIVTSRSLEDKLASAIERHIESSKMLRKFSELHNIHGIQRHVGRVIGVYPPPRATMSRKYWKKSQSRSGYWIPKTKEIQDELNSFFVYAPDWLTKELTGDDMAFFGDDHTFFYITMCKIENPTRFLLTIPSSKDGWWKPNQEDATMIAWSQYFKMGEESSEKEVK